MKKKPKAPLLDLHGFTLADVGAAVDRFLVQSAKGGAPRVRIMTGKGTGTVQKAVAAYLKQAGYPWEFERMADGRPNDGVLIIHME